MASNMNLLSQARLALSLALARKLTLRKLCVHASNHLRHLARSEKSGRAPSLLLLDPTNACNLACSACRDTHGFIYNQFYKDKPVRIDVGRMDFTLYESILQELSPDILMAVLYVQGEPLLHKRIFDMIQLATDLHVATMIATNGMLLGEEESRHLVDAGLDVIKVAVSGFTQDMYGRYHRGGDIEQIKQNVVQLAQTRNKANRSLEIIIDYILFDYNHAELASFRTFCKMHGISCATRMGKMPTGFKDGNAEFPPAAPSKNICQWPWNVAVVNWDGQVWPCCQFPVAADPIALGQIVPGQISLGQIWNGPDYRAFRDMHASKGRICYVCEHCDWDNVGLQSEDNSRIDPKRDTPCGN
jgi:radical SAM protein with 4Fe4S-binding SPASM domain